MSQVLVVGKWFEFDPRRTYLKPTTSETPADACVVGLSAIGAAPGDYVALRGVGSWRPGGSLPTIERMSGVFRKSKTGFLAPAPSGQEKPFENWAPPTGPAPRLDQDFDISYAQDVIVRVPKNAKEIALNSGDWKFWDNVPEANCGVLVSLPNKRAPTPLPFEVVDVDQVIPSTPDPERLAEILANAPGNPPAASSYSTSPFARTSGVDNFPQWRGWYSPGAWLPQWSGYGADRNGDKHWGWDIFCPAGSVLIAPAGPTLFEWFPNVKGYGNVASFAFTHKKELYRLFYAHCSESLVAHGTKVSTGQQVARSGCSGDTATSERCGQQLPGGGRTDHVHVGLAKGAISPVNILNPATFLKWDIRTP